MIAVGVILVIVGICALALLITAGSSGKIEDEILERGLKDISSYGGTDDED